MAKEYIEREALLRLNRRYTPSIAENNGFVPKDWSINLADALAIPAANVRENAKGEWEPGVCFCPICGEDKFKGLDADIIWSDWMPHFCPNCGADMTGGNDG